jgi:hypothetical protein
MENMGIDIPFTMMAISFIQNTHLHIGTVETDKTHDILLASLTPVMRL